MKITDNQWDKIRKYFPEEQKYPRKAGRKSVDTHKIYESGFRQFLDYKK